MNALYYEELKGPQAIKRGEREQPIPGPNEVLVRMKAFSLNRLDLWVMTGAYPAPIPLPHLFGSDGSGVVEEAGAGSPFGAGDEVVVYPGLFCGRCASCLSGRENECSQFRIIGVQDNGLSAEFVALPAVNLLPKPTGLSFVEAAAMGITYTTAWNSLVLRAGLRQGETVLIQGGGSGAGTALIQVAKLYNARIITTVGDDSKKAAAQKLGADHVINHTTEDVAAAVKRITAGELVDIAVDHAGSLTINTSLACLRRGGRLVTFGATTGDKAELSLRYLFGKNITIHGVYVGPRSALQHCLRLAPDRLRPMIDSVFPAVEAAAAYEKLLSRKIFGKIVVTLP